MSTPTVPPDLDAIRRLLRPDMPAIPDILGAWPHGEGPLADVPLLDPGEVAPRAFSELAGTVRVASTSPTLVTVAALLDIPDDGGVLVAAMALNPHDLSASPDDVRSREVLAEAGARSEDVMVEVTALIGPIEPGGPVAGVGVVRPLAYADPAHFPHAEDTATYGADVVEAARDAVAEDRELITDLAGKPFTPLPGDLARIWSPMFQVTRTATAGLAARRAAAGGA